MKRIIFNAILMLCFLSAKAQKMEIRLSDQTFPLNGNVSFLIYNADSLSVFFNVQLEKEEKNSRYVLYTEDVFSRSDDKNMVLCLKPNNHSKLSFKLRRQEILHIVKHKIQVKAPNKLHQKGVFRLKLNCGFSASDMHRVVYSDSFTIR